MCGRMPGTLHLHANSQPINCPATYECNSKKTVALQILYITITKNKNSNKKLLSLNHQTMIQISNNDFMYANIIIQQTNTYSVRVRQLQRA